MTNEQTITFLLSSFFSLSLSLSSSSSSSSSSASCSFYSSLSLTFTGVATFDVAIDDVHVYSGTLKPANEEIDHQGQSVLFTHDPEIVKREASTINYCGSVEQSVLLINERQVMGGTLVTTSQRGVGAWHGDVPVNLEMRPTTAAPAGSRRWK